MKKLLVAAILANLADLTMYLRASPAVVAADETSPLPHVLGPVAGGIAAKLILAAALTLIMVVARRRPRTAAVLLAFATLIGLVGAASGAIVG
jgi:hypothetical protein